MSVSALDSKVPSEHSQSRSTSGGDTDNESAGWIEIEDNEDRASLDSEATDSPDGGGWHRNVRQRIRRFSISTRKSISHFLNPSAYLLSRGLTLMDIEELSMLHPLSRRQFCCLMDEFLTLCGVDIYDEEQNQRTVSTISMDRMMQCVYLKHNPLKKRVAAIFQQDLRDEDGSARHEISFFDFSRCLAVFSAETPRAKKIRFAFRLYDVADDGCISKQNLLDVLTLVIGDKFEESQINKIVSDTFSHCSLNHDGNIDFPEFHSMVGVGDIAGKFTINF